MNKSIKNAIKIRNDLSDIVVKDGKYIGHYELKNGYSGGTQYIDVDLGYCEEYTKEKTLNGGTLIKRNGEKVFSFGP